ncbi:MAG: adenosylcobinamide-GDP ribazoletransferase [Paracoccus sp. (in: a-proteobacteria)]|nr:adenosylcobinamide-GDP ribazoletransferase [Paracoccus sp. (in: a-proteobacteria)]
MARLQQLVLALVFLTRLPLGRFLPARVLPLSSAAWAFPVAGLVIGIIAALPLWFLGPGLLPASLSVALSIWLTGALHEDALADFADAGGGRDRADRLRIMRDSAVGSYGVAALVCVTLIRVAALMTAGPVALIAAAAAGRVAPVVLMQALPAARDDGLGRHAGRPGMDQTAIAMGIGVIALAVAAPGSRALFLALLLSACATMAVSRRAARLVGGQTGDVLGAACLLVETAALVGIACALR